MKIDLRYGTETIEFDLPHRRFDVLDADSGVPALNDAEIGACFDDPVGSDRLEEIVGPGDSVLIVVPDATRQTASDSIVNLLVRRLIANGTLPYEIAIIFATGIHRQVSNEEKQRLITPFILQRIKTLDHNARDLMRAAGLDSLRFAGFGEINGTPIELNRVLTEYDRVVVVGGIGFHYFAGFTGGRKLICPGLASARTIAATHRLAFDFEERRRREGVGPGILDGNAVHEAFVEVVEECPPSFAVNTIVNESGHPVEVICGDWIKSHRVACERFAESHTVAIGEKRDLVIVSCGGTPHDLNLIQAHKALDAGSRACAEGGTIVFLAECADGLGRPDFMNWFDAAGSDGIAELLCENYEVNGQTAWSLREKTERFDVRMISSLDAEVLSSMGIVKLGSLSEIDLNLPGYIIRTGAKLLIKEQKKR